MNEFVNVNASFLETFHQNNITKTCFQSVCISCLQQNVAFVNLSTCKHASFFDFFYKYKVDYQNSVICHECHHFLKKLELFKQQVEESLVVLNGQAQNIEPKKKFQDLQISNTQGDDASLKYEYSENEKRDNAQQEHYNELTTEVKIEHESYSDFETDVPLSQIKKEIKKIKKKKKKGKRKEVVTKSNKSSKKRSPLAEKYEGKIAVITLSREEMLEERERDAKKQNYLKLPFKCESCITGFDHELTLKDHMEKRHGPKQGGYECNICKSILSTDISYKEHTKRHTRRYECQACGKRNNSIYSVIKHYNDQHGTIDTQFVCQECGFTTDSHRSYRYHRDKHKQKQQCSLCDSTFVNNSGLRVHMFTVHKQSGRVYTCGACGKSYSGRSGLAAHTAAAHSSHSTLDAYCAKCRTHYNTPQNLTVHKQSGRVYTCGACGKSYSGRSGLAAHAAAAHSSHSTLDAYCAQCRTHFKTPHNLAHHLRTHSKHVTTQHKRFICDECGVKFLTKGSLQEHIDFVHLKSGKHKCDKCSKVFINGSALKKHVNFVHKKIRPPRNKICDHCGRGFTTLSILECHVRTHTGARPLRCARCPATFAHSAALYTHNKLIHKGQARTQPSHN